MVSWAEIAKRGHEKSKIEERKRLEYLASLNQFGYKKPLKNSRLDRQKTILLLTKVFDSDLLRNIYTYVGTEYQYFVTENTVFCCGIIYAGFNIIDEWNLNEDEFPSTYKSYKEYRKYSNYLDHDEIRAFYGEEFATKKYIEYDLKTFYYIIFYESDHLKIRFYKNKEEFDKRYYSYIIKDFDHINMPEAVNHIKRYNTVVNKIFTTIKKN